MDISTDEPIREGFLLIVSYVLREVGGCETNGGT